MNGDPEPTPGGGVQSSLDDPWQVIEAGLAAFEPGFVLEREQPPGQPRASIDAGTLPPAPAATP